jgi:hypothetical protein
MSKMADERNDTNNEVNNRLHKRTEEKGNANKGFSKLLLEKFSVVI